MPIDVMGVGFDSLTMDEAVARARDLMAERRAAYVVTPNPEIVMRCREDAAAMQAVQNADLVLADGIGVIYGAKILGTPLRAKLPGIDFAAALMTQMGREGKSVFLLGAKPGVADAAGEKLRERFPGLVIAGTNDGYFQDDDPVVEKINAVQPDLLLVCLGAPKQELWMEKNGPATGAQRPASARRSYGGSRRQSGRVCRQRQARTEVFSEARSRVVLPAHQRAEAHRPHDEIAEIPVCGHRPQAAGEETPWRRVN